MSFTFEAVRGYKPGPENLITPTWVEDSDWEGREPGALRPLHPLHIILRQTCDERPN